MRLGPPASSSGPFPPAPCKCPGATTQRCVNTLRGTPCEDKSTGGKEGRRPAHSSRRWAPFPFCSRNSLVLGFSCQPFSVLSRVHTAPLSLLHPDNLCARMRKSTAIGMQRDTRGRAGCGGRVVVTARQNLILSSRQSACARTICVGGNLTSWAMSKLPPLLSPKRSALPESRARPQES